MSRIYNIYQWEAENVGKKKSKIFHFWSFFWKANLIFFLITLVVFFIANHQAIHVQMREQKSIDSDFDGKSDIIEKELGEGIPEKTF